MISFDIASEVDPIPMKLETISVNESRSDFIAVFWAHSDLRAGGSVAYYFAIDHPDFGGELVDMSTALIGQAFPEQSNFKPDYVFICTWLGVGYWNNHSDKVIYIEL